MPEDLDCFWTGFLENREYCYEKQFSEEKEANIAKILTCDPANWHLGKLNPPILQGPNIGKCGPTYANAACSPVNYTKNGESVFTPCCRNAKCQISSGFPQKKL